MHYLKQFTEDSKSLFCSSKFPWARERISSKSVDILAIPKTGKQK
jgi:hypothetical protein